MKPWSFFSLNQSISPRILPLSIGAARAAGRRAPALA
jgi:hypothetical protein